MRKALVGDPSFHLPVRTAVRNPVPRGLPSPVTLSYPNKVASVESRSKVTSAEPLGVATATGTRDGTTSWYTDDFSPYSSGLANPIGVRSPVLATAWMAATTGQARLVP